MRNMRPKNLYYKIEKTEHEARRKRAQENSEADCKNSEER